ncbi:CBS domain-containing protein [Streptomyces sp. NRRL B-24572]|uniref:CBS domain-containing protein n=1 Tax=Streptomyces sp. NRRL B-24572 TaxID=1962156 RepID=UPI00358F8813
MSVRPDAPVKEIARLLDEFGITAVCVVDEANRPLGVASERDLVRRRANSGGGSSAVEPIHGPAHRDRVPRNPARR